MNLNGVFTQEGGAIDQVSGQLSNYGAYTYKSGDFNSHLVNYGEVSLQGLFVASRGMENYSDVVIANGHAAYLNGTGLNNSGSFTLNGGVLGGTGPLVNNAYLSGYGTISGSGGLVNYGFLTQSGGNLALNNTGANANYGNMDLATDKFFTRGSGATLSNQGTFNLNSSIVSGTGTLNNSYGGTISGKGTIASNFANNGGVVVVDSGTTAITKPFSNSGMLQLTNFTANLTGGAITNTGSIEGRGQVGNNITNTGIIEALGGTLTLGGAVTNNPGGLMTASTGGKLLITSGLNTNAGTINLTGGTFDNNNHILSNTSQISGYGTFRTGALSNIGTMILSGSTANTTVS